MDEATKKAAQEETRQARQSGLIKPKPCQNCGYDDRRVVHAHHPDYSRVLEVVWLCRKCHAKEHSRLAREKRERLTESLMAIRRRQLV